MKVCGLPLTLKVHHKIINGIQTQLNIDEYKLDSCAINETSAQWLEYNIKNKKNYFINLFVDFFPL